MHGRARGVMGDMWVCGHIVRRVAASPLCFADFEVRRRKKEGGGEARWGQWAIRRGKGFTNKSDSLLEGWVGIGTCPESVSYRLWQDLI